jgi:hypothetical protein
MTDWYQQQLTPATVLECNIRVGVIPEQDHVQVLVELKDPVTGIQLGMWTKPHGGMCSLRTRIAWACAQAIEVVERASEPF